MHSHNNNTHLYAIPTHRYEKEGKYLNKMNTFTDFCDCAEFLINSGYTRACELAISGRSAGGLLMVKLVLWNGYGLWAWVCTCVGQAKA